MLAYVQNAAPADSTIQVDQVDAHLWQKPILSVIVPTFNEANYIEACLCSIENGLKGIRAEVIVIDGMSQDGTRDIVQRHVASSDGYLFLMDNADVYQVYALNIGIKRARGEFLIRCDAHSLYPQDYFRNILAFYATDEAKVYGNVGIECLTKTITSTRLQEGLPLAMSSRIGVGVSHRVFEAITHSRSVDTLLFGAWRREVFEKVGLFDTAFIRGQDYEHNLRVRRSGLKVAMIPGSPFTYYTRHNFQKMRRMIYQYAYVKGQLLRKDGIIPNIRSQIPVCFVTSLLLLLFAFPFVGLSVAFVYLFIVAGISAMRVSSSGLVAAFGMFVAIPQMHVSHAVGFLHGLISNPRYQAFIRKAGYTR
jgi:glycosyltransferase involved in cell wall biosynthesis